MNYKKIVLLGFFIALILGSLLFILKLKSLSNPPKKDQHKIDSFIDGLHYIQYNKKGHPSRILLAKKTTHIAYQDTSYFTEPRITLYDQNNHPWHISAAHGKSKNNEQQQIYLWQQVIVHQPASKKNPDFKMHTSTLTYYPQKKFAKTKSPVTILRPNSVVKATGANINFQTGTTRLLSKTRGVYEKQSH